MDAFQRALWAFPAAFALHVAEEAPGFTRWARGHASARYTAHDFVRDNALGFALTLGATALVARAPARGFRPFYVFVLTQQAVGNAVFHAVTGAPGRLSAIGMVLPLWARITTLARRRGMLGRRDVVAALAVGGTVHAAAVAQQVYFLPVPGRGRA
jgi:hypothetical protein